MANTLAVMILHGNPNKVNAGSFNGTSSFIFGPKEILLLKKWFCEGPVKKPTNNFVDPWKCRQI